jgi:hypothetical protein
MATVPVAGDKVGGGARAAHPAVAAGDVPGVSWRHIDGSAEAPALPVEVGERLDGMTLRVSQVVGEHLAHRRPRDDRPAVHLPAGEEHPRETQPVVGGADEAAAAGLERRARLPHLLGVGGLERASRTGQVVAGKAILLAGREDEAAIGHPERLEEPLGEEASGRRAG